MLYHGLLRRFTSGGTYSASLGREETAEETGVSSLSTCGCLSVCTKLLVCRFDADIVTRADPDTPKFTFTLSEYIERFGDFTGPTSRLGGPGSEVFGAPGSLELILDVILENNEVFGASSGFSGSAGTDGVTDTTGWGTDEAPTSETVSAGGIRGSVTRDLWSEPRLLVTSD